MTSSVFIAVCFDGEWKEDETSKLSKYWLPKGSQGWTGVAVETNVTFSELLEIIYNSIDIDRNEFGLEIAYKPAYSLITHPIFIKKDADVKPFLVHACSRDSDRSPLYVTLIPKRSDTHVRERHQISDLVNDENQNFMNCDDGGDRFLKDGQDVDVDVDADADEDEVVDEDEDEVEDDEENENEDDGGERMEEEYVNRHNNEINPDFRMFSDDYFEGVIHTSHIPDALSPGNLCPISLDHDLPSSFLPQPQNEVEEEGSGDYANIFPVSSQHGVSATDFCGIGSNVVPIVSSQSRGREFYRNKFFPSKNDLKVSLHMHAIRHNFEFKVKKSNKTTFVVVCIDPNCQWRLRATGKNNSSFFQIRTYKDQHTCSPELRQNRHRQASASVIGRHVMNSYRGCNKGPNPSKIKDLALNDLGVNITYWKAWKARSVARDLIRGTAEKSYALLPCYLAMMKVVNPGTTTALLTDGEGRFLYFFIAFIISIKGFRFMRKVICIDGTFLKCKYKGTLLTATARDGNNYIYPIAWAIVDSENEASWTWFLTRLREKIPDALDLVFVSNRSQSIKNVIHGVYPNSKHSACIWHIEQNIKSRFKGGSIVSLFKSAAEAYKVQEFNLYFNDIKALHPVVATYLEDIGFEYWSRAHFSGLRYDIMTNNNSALHNAPLNDAREYPIVALLDNIRKMMTTWFHTRKNAANEHTYQCTPEIEKVLRSRHDESLTMKVDDVDQVMYEVIDGASNALVNLGANSCTCRVFDLDKIPCAHAIAVARSKNMSVYTLCSPYYTTQYWRAAYADSIYPVPPTSEWEFPERIRSIMVLPPILRQRSGRPKNKRIPSVGEQTRRKRKCGNCGGLGHNKKTCMNSIPPPLVKNTL